MEYFDIVDENGMPTGEIVERSEAHRTGARHRTAHIWVLKREGDGIKILLQQRSFTKDSFPGKLDTSSAGHIQAGDEPLVSALRELSEELGIRAETADLAFVGNFKVFYSEVFYGKPFIDDEVVFVYAYEKPVELSSLNLQKEELEGANWYDLYETIERVKAHDDRYCVPIEGLLMIEKYIRESGK